MRNVIIIAAAIIVLVAFTASASACTGQAGSKYRPTPPSFSLNFEE